MVQNITFVDRNNRNRLVFDCQTGTSSIIVLDGSEGSTSNALGTPVASSSDYDNLDIFGDDEAVRNKNNNYPGGTIVGKYSFGYSQRKDGLMIITLLTHFDPPTQDLFITDVTKPVWLENKAIGGGNSIIVHRLLRTKSVCIFRKPFVSMDEKEFEDVTLRNIISQLSTGDLYYSSDLDLTNGLQYITKRGLDNGGGGNQSLNFSEIDERFFWNKNILGSFVESPEYHPFIVPLISGFIGSFVMIDTPIPIRLVLLSRISSKMAGPRFWNRGVDEKGDVAVEVETDLLCISREKTASYRILRGSIPLFWNQWSVGLEQRPPINTQQLLTENSTNSLRTHFERLLEIYGNGISCLDLVDRKECAGFYAPISTAYESVIRAWKHPFISYSNFPFSNHSASSSSSKLKMQRLVQADMKNHGFFLCNNNRKEGSQRFSVLMKQTGIFRINDIDCVDDTSLSSFLLCEIALKSMLFELGVGNKPLGAKNQMAFEQLFVQMSDRISNYYVGSNSRLSSLIRASLFTGPQDNYIRIVRYYISRFQSYVLQDGLDTLHTTIQKDTIKDQLLLRRRIIHSDLSFAWPLTLLLLLKRFTAPRQIKGWISFLLSLIWMLIYVTLIILFGLDASLFIRKPKILMRISELPKLNKETKGLMEFFSSLDVEDNERAGLFR